jgi:hypothetical protein
MLLLGRGTRPITLTQKEGVVVQRTAIGLLCAMAAAAGWIAPALAQTPSSRNTKIGPSGTEVVCSENEFLISSQSEVDFDAAPDYVDPTPAAALERLAEGYPVLRAAVVTDVNLTRWEGASALIRALPPGAVDALNVQAATVPDAGRSGSEPVALVVDIATDGSGATGASLRFVRTASGWTLERMVACESTLFGTESVHQVMGDVGSQAVDTTAHDRSDP